MTVLWSLTCAAVILSLLQENNLFNSIPHKVKCRVKHLYDNCSMIVFSDHVSSLTTFYKTHFRVRVFKIDPTSVKQDQNFFSVQEKER